MATRDRHPKQTGEVSLRLWLVLFRAARSIEAHAQRHISSLGMCGSDFAVLEALHNKGPLTVGEIGRKVLLTSGSMTTAVDRLEARGLVSRRAGEGDRRARTVHLTAAGRALIAAAFVEHAAAIGHAVSALSTAEQRSLAGLLVKLGTGADERLRALAAARK